MVVDDPLSPFLRMSLGPFLPELCTSFSPSCCRYAGLAKLWQGLYCFIYMKIQSSSQAAAGILLPRNLSTAFLPCLSLVQQGSAMCNGFLGEVTLSPLGSLQHFYYLHHFLLLIYLPKHLSPQVPPFPHTRRLAPNV